MFVFNIRSIYSKCFTFHTKKCNKPQAEGKVNSRLYSRIQEKFNTSAIKKQNNEAQLLVYIISMVELDQRSAANTLVNKMRLDIFVLLNIFNY